MEFSLEQQKEELVSCIHFLHNLGYAPATSSNYSFRRPGDQNFYISASGKDKGLFAKSDLMLVDAGGKAIDDPRKPSAETLLHVLIYKRLSEVGCVLHTHTVYNTVLSSIYGPIGKLKLEGYEILKGLSGIRTHETSIEIPVFENSQDMTALSAKIVNYWDQHPEMRTFLLAGHGMYTWGKTIAEAKRHVEVLEFLFDCHYKINTFSFPSIN